MFLLRHKSAAVEPTASFFADDAARQRGSPDNWRHAVESKQCSSHEKEPDKQPLNHESDVISDIRDDNKSKKMKRGAHHQPGMLGCVITKPAKRWKTVTI